MAREASPPERDRLTPNKETTMFRGKGGEPLSRPKVHTKVTPTQPSSTQTTKSSKVKRKDRSGNEEEGGGDREGVSRQEKGERGGTEGQGDGRNKGTRQQRGQPTSQTGKKQTTNITKQKSKRTPTLLPANAEQDWGSGRRGKHGKAALNPSPDKSGHRARVLLLPSGRV